MILVMRSKQPTSEDCSYNLNAIFEIYTDVVKSPSFQRRKAAEYSSVGLPSVKRKMIGFQSPFCSRGRNQPLEGLEMFNATDFKLVGAYPIDKESYASLSAGKQTKINTMELVGVPASIPCQQKKHQLSA